MSKLTIITVVYNDINGLKKTIDCIRRQKGVCDNYNFVIIDGGSSDGTLDLIKENLDIINYFVSEKDNGIYDAMNKGIKNTESDWMMFLNAGDVFYDDFSLSSIMSEIQKNKNACNFIYYDCLVDNTLYSKKFELSTFVKDMICHQTIIYSKAILEAFSLKYRFSSDYEHIINKFYEIKHHHVSEILVIYDTTGISSNRKNSLKIWLERFSIVWSSKFNIVEKLWLSSWAMIAIPFHFILRFKK